MHLLSQNQKPPIFLNKPTLLCVTSIMAEDEDESELSAKQNHEIGTSSYSSLFFKYVSVGFCLLLYS
jgi:hypothetical protein